MIVTMDGTDRRRSKGRRKVGADAEAGVDKAFDLWLARGLHQLYDTVAQEAVPDEWLRLIDQDRGKDKGEPT